MIASTTWRASAGYLRRHPWQLALAVLGIVIGVAVIVAVDLANASARKAFVLSMEAVTGAATHQVVGGPRGVDERLYVDLRVVHGVEAIAPVVDGTLRVGERALQVFGIDLLAEPAVRSATNRLLTDGTGEPPVRAFMTVPGAVAMSRSTARRLGLAPGDGFVVSAAGRSHEAVVTVAIDDDGGGADLLYVDIATAQEWLGRDGWLSRIDARLDGEEAIAQLRALLPAGTLLLPAARRTEATLDLSAGFMTNLTAMSLLALLVGVFLIYNSMSFSVLQRRTLIGTLRALGVTRAQLFALVLTEAAVLGLCASIAGLLAGAWLGERLLALVAQSINDLYFRVSVTDVAVAPLSVVKGLAAGIGAALLAAAVPAAEATAYSPRLAMTRSALEQHASRALPRVALAGITAILIAVLVLAVSGRSLGAGLGAVFGLIIGFALCVPWLVAAASRWLAPVAAVVGGILARLTVAGVAASLSRTGVAIVALAVAVSATIGVGVMVDSFRASVTDWLDQTLQADYYVRVADGALDPALVDRLTALAGVNAYSTGRRVAIEGPDAYTRVVALQMAPGSYAGVELIDADPDRVWPRWESDDVVLVSQSYAYLNDVTAGDTLKLRTPAGERRFTVAASYRSYDVEGSAVLMSRAVYDRHFDDPRIDTVGLYLADEAAPAVVLAAIEAASAGLQAVEVVSNRDIRSRSLEVFDRTFVITDILYWLAAGVAFIGILGAMLALQLERARELATLRALGVTPAQLGASICAQTGLIGLLSGLAAIPLGLVMAYVLIEVINRRAFGWEIEMRVDVPILAAAVSFAVASGLLAGLYPAWRAAHSEPALAMREE